MIASLYVHLNRRKWKKSERKKGYEGCRTWLFRCGQNKGLHRAFSPQVWTINISTGHHKVCAKKKAMKMVKTRSRSIFYRRYKQILEGQGARYLKKKNLVGRSTNGSADSESNAKRNGVIAHLMEADAIVAIGCCSKWNPLPMASVATSTFLA